MSNKQSYESFNDASIIDNTYINNDLSYIKTLESLYINHSKDKINLYKRLNNIYGKGKSKSLENYLYNKSLDINNKCKSYIENSNESYNNLIMSRESVVGGVITLGVGLISLMVVLLSVIKSVKKSLYQIIGRYNIKKLATILLKDKKIYSAITDLNNDIVFFNKTVQNVPKNNIINDIKTLLKPIKNDNIKNIDINFDKIDIKEDINDMMHTLLFKQKHNINDDINKIQIFNMIISVSYKKLNYDEDGDLEDSSIDYMDDVEKKIKKMESEIKNIINKYLKNINITIKCSYDYGKDYSDQYYKIYASLSRDHSSLLKMIMDKIK